MNSEISQSNRIVWETDVTAKITVIRGACQRLLGLDPNQLIGTKLTNLPSKEQRIDIASAIAAILQEAQESPKSLMLPRLQVRLKTTSDKTLLFSRQIDIRLGAKQEFIGLSVSDRLASEHDTYDSATELPVLFKTLLELGSDSV